jgi:hypothetical protein
MTFSAKSCDIPNQAYSKTLMLNTRNSATQNMRVELHKNSQKGERHYGTWTRS